jgi:hypothetical protein
VLDTAGVQIWPATPGRHCHLQQLHPRRDPADGDHRGGQPDLGIGQTTTVTITFSEAVSNFDLSDLSVANGDLSNLSSSDGGKTWTATFTPTANVTDPTNFIALDTSNVTDLAGNAGRRWRCRTTTPSTPSGPPPRWWWPTRTWASARPPR